MSNWLRLCIAAILLIFQIGELTAQVDMSRDEIAEALRFAESRRMRIEITIRQQYHYAVAGEKDHRQTTYRLSDATGRYRFRQEREIQRDDGRTSNHEELTVWNGQELRSRGRSVDKPTSPNTLGITEEIPMYHMYDDDIWPFLGIFIDFPISERSPRMRISEALANTKSTARISRISEDGRELIQIDILDPWHLADSEGEGPEFIYKFDPARDWLMVESIASNRGRESDRYATRYSKRIHVTRAKQFEDEWIPMEAEVEQIMRFQEADWNGSDMEQFDTTPIIEHGDDGIVREISPSTITVVDVDVNPEISDEEFTINVADLPEGSSVVDSRLGISYKLGENLIYMDGHLNRVGRTITDEITPGELKELMADAEPLINPEAAKAEETLEPVSPKGAWTTRSAYAFAFIGVGVGVLGFYVWRRQHAA